MKTTKRDSPENKVEFAVVLEPAEIAHAHVAAVKMLAKNVKIKGFREGHVPENVAEQAIKPTDLAAEETNHAISTALSEIVRAENLQILDQPQIELTKFVPGATLEFKATLEIVPEIKLPDLKKIAVKKSVAKFSAEQVDQVLENLRRGQAVKAKVERAAKNGDEAEIDFEGFADGVAFEGGKGEKYPLILGSGSFIPGFEEQIVGHAPGEDFDVKVDFPKDYGAKNLAGKPATFKVKLHAVREVKMPALDDDFAKKMAPDLATIDALKADISRELGARADEDAEAKFQNEIVDAIAKKTDFTVPKILIDDQLAAIEQEFATNLAYRGMSLEQYLAGEKLAHDAWVERDLRPAAEARVKNSMILAQLAREWGITASDAEVAAEQEKLMAQYSRPELRENLRRPDAVREIAQHVVTEKTLKKLEQEIGK